MMNFELNFNIDSMNMDCKYLNSISFSIIFWEINIIINVNEIIFENKQIN